MSFLPLATSQTQRRRTSWPAQRIRIIIVLAGLAQIQVAHQRYPEAIAFYQQALTIIPLPEYAAALGDVLTKVERHEDATKQYALVEYIGHLTTLNQVLYNRELATFYVDHDMKLTEALALAKPSIICSAKDSEARHEPG